MKLIAFKVSNGFEVQTSDLPEIQKWKDGKMVQIEVTAPRNIKFHRKFFAMLNIAFDNQDVYHNRAAFLDVIKYGIYHVKSIVMPNGQISYAPKSISFAKMDNSEFEKFYNSAGEYIEKAFGIDWHLLSQEADKF